MVCRLSFSFFFFNDTATTEIYTLSLHDALPICHLRHVHDVGQDADQAEPRDRSESTRLNSSHANISYAVFCLKKKKKKKQRTKNTKNTKKTTTTKKQIHITTIK